MTTIRNLLLLLIVLSNFSSFAQNTDQVKKKGPADSYARSSISYLLLDFSNEKYASMLKDAINNTTMPSKFDNNDLKKKVIPAPYYHSENIGLIKQNTESVRKALVSENYAIDVVKYWWKIRSDGSYSTDLIKERGEYNATDDDFDKAMATKVGRAKIGDQGLKLIGNSYVLVLDYNNIQSMDEIYDAQDKAARATAEKNKTEFKPVKRIKNGFIGKITSYLFKMNYPDTVQGYFDESFIDEKKIDLGKLNNIFSQVYSPLTLITTESQSVEGTQPNPGEFLAPKVQKSREELMAVLVNNGVTKSLNLIETRIEAFRVKTPVTNVNPIRAKIGRKESLTHERRYFVWEYVSNASDNVVARKKGVIRAGKVIDNRQDELGNTRESSFYQIGGGKITEGMTLQEAKDMGIGLGAGIGSDGFVMRLDINIGQWIDMPLKQWKLYGDLGISKKELEWELFPAASTTFPTGPADFSSTKFSVGLLKDIPFMHNFHLGAYLGYGFETLTWDDAEDKESLNASGLQFGAKIGMNLFSPSFQVIGTINGYGFGNVQYTPAGENPESEDLGVKWADMFPDKQSVSFNLSLRLNF